MMDYADSLRSDFLLFLILGECELSCEKKQVTIFLPKLNCCHLNLSKSYVV